jgi:hypothetical protein
VKSSSPKVHTAFTQSNKNFTESNKEFTNNSSIVCEQFTQDEIHIIKDMLKSWQEVSSTNKLMSKVFIATSSSYHKVTKEMKKGNNFHLKTHNNAVQSIQRL